MQNFIDLARLEESADTERDIAYSCDVWVLHEENKLSVDLSVRDRDIIVGSQENGWLNDVIIDAAMELILKNKHHHNICIYQSCRCRTLVNDHEH